jgi:hypothetical protein
MPVLSTLGAAAARGFGFLGKVVQAIDEYFEYVTMLLPGNGTNGAQNNTFLDSSTNNFSITRNGNTTQGTFAPYGANWSNFFNGPSSGTYFETPTNTAFQLGTSDFTIEFWVFITSGASQTCVCRTDTGGSAQNGMLLGYSDGTDILWYATSNGSTWNIISGGVLCSVASVKNTWAHFAYVRSGSTFTAYVNGTQAYTTTSSAAINQVTNGFRIGTANTGTGATNFGGYISNFRYVKGSAVYTANFTPPTAPLTAITNTSLLTCQSNRFIDNSANNFTITRNGDVSVQVFSPFSPTASYAAGTNGGSGYFDGSGDQLTAAANNAFVFGTGDFCIEGFFFVTADSTSNIATIVSNTAGGNNGWIFSYYTGGFRFQATGVLLFQITSSLNTWHHVVICRASGTTSIFIDGVRQGTTSTAYTWSDNSTLNIGYRGADAYFTGYMSNVRLVKGSSVYDPTQTTITVPTAPLTAITNTSLLLNFTNAGVIDNAMMNNLETVGNAQISTTQSKFGGASMLFDGSGDAVTAPPTVNLAMGTGDFTIEMWVYGANSGSTVGGAYPRIFQLGAAQTVNTIECYNGAGTMYVEMLGTGVTFTASTLLNSTWNHFAVTRAGTSLRAFVNGTQVASTTSSNNLTSPITNASFIGASTASSGNFNGYIDDLRITKGFARYTANFTAPTAPFPTR